jgi:hypothetical protein
VSNLRFLADESCDFGVVRALRAAGFDVLAVGEFMKRSVDRDLIEQAKREERILITEDKDFGWLVFASHTDSHQTHPSAVTSHHPLHPSALRPHPLFKYIPYV